MKINISKILRPLPLRGYDEVMGDVKMFVWVNIPREVREGYADLVQETLESRKTIISVEKELKAAREMLSKKKDDEVSAEDKKKHEEIKSRLAESVEARAVLELDEKLYAWFSTVWSQGDDAETHFSVDEVRELFEATKENDPGFWPWVTAETLGLIWAYRAQKKRK
jgi:hypothetical protein